MTGTVSPLTDGDLPLLARLLAENSLPTRYCVVAATNISL
jgi:hypothetical protein